MLHNLIQGLTTLGTPAAIGWLFIGALVGLIFGIIPGLGGAVVLSMILVFVYDVNLLATLCLFLGVHAGSYYASSMSSILLNTPSHPESWAVTLDGYPMARKGGAGRALGLSAASTCIGGAIGFVIMIASLPVLNSLPSVFHPPEYLALVTIAMLLVGTLGAGSVLKALASAGLGLMCASIGSSIITGGLRYTFGQISLIDGVSLVAIALGTLALPQMILMFGTGSSVMHQDLAGNKLKESQAVRIDSSTRNNVGGITETFRHWLSNLVAGVVGTVIGAVPGVGGFTANFMSYGVRKQLSNNRDEYGTGIPEGIISAEGSNLAKEYGHMIPLLGLGIPGGVGGALFIGALAIKDVHTGYGFGDTYPVIPYQIAWILLITGIIGTGLGVLFGPQLARITFVPGPVIVPFVIAMSIIGPYLTDSTYLAVVEVILSTIVGFVLIRLRYPIATFILALILGPTFETNAYLTQRIFPGFTFIEHRPIADALFGLTIVVLIAKIVSTRQESRRAKQAAEAELSVAADSDEQKRIAHEIALRKNPHPLVSLITTALLLLSSVSFIYYGFAKYDFTTRLMPIIGALVVAVPALFMLPADVWHYVTSRRYKEAEGGPAGPAIPAEPVQPEPLSVPAPRTAVQVPVLAGAVASVPGVDGVHEVAVRPRPQRLLRLIRWSQLSLGRRSATIGGAAMVSTPASSSACWVAALTLGAYLFGYSYTVPIFMLVYGLTATRRGLASRRNQVIFSVVAAVAMWFITKELLDISHQVFTPRFISERKPIRSSQTVGGPPLYAGTTWTQMPCTHKGEVMERASRNPVDSGARRKRFVAILVPAVVALLVAGCASSSSAGAGSPAGRRAAARRRTPRPVRTSRSTATKRSRSSSTMRPARTTIAKCRR